MSTIESSDALRVKRGAHRRPALDPGRLRHRADQAPAAQPRTYTTASKIRAWMLVLPVDAIMLMVPVIWTPGQWKAYVSMSLLAVVLLTGGGRYRARLHLSVLDELPLIVGRVLVAAAIVATVIALRHEQESVTTFLSNVATSLGLVVAGRIATLRVISWSRSRRLTAHRVVMIGGGPVAAELAQLVHDDPRYGLFVVGFVDDDPDCVAAAASPFLGTLADLDSAVRKAQADVLLVADGDFSERDLLDVARTPACGPCDMLIVPRMHHFHTQTGLADHIGSIPIMRIRTPSLRGPARAIKRLFDLLLAGLAFLIVLPVMAVCALAVRLEGGPGVLFRQPRVGRDGVIFDCLKFRSMRPVDDDESATQWSVANDTRVGPVGRFLRRTSLDELPQIWNILRGDMSVVGPRPERPHFVDRFSAEFERYAHRHRVQSGLTGFAQVNGLRGDTSIANRARYDNYYIENWTLWLDIKIIIRTFAEVFMARGR
jgi:exopolysaccharide biosynthesis polyprenyl glycosylphosphotransferase